MVDMEKNLRLSLQRAVKQGLMETKYAEEPVTYAQALVTYHYLQNEPIQEQYPDQNQVARNSMNQATAAITRGQVTTQSPARQAYGQFTESQQRQGSDSPGNRTIQHDLVQRKLTQP